MENDLDFGATGIQFDLPFLYSLLSIIMIDLILAGDNAVLIAMAVRSLPLPKRRIGIWVGAGGAVILRLVLTFFIAQLLQVPYIKLAGGVFILWIAVKLFIHGAPGGEEKEAATVAQAVRLIMFADLSMSLDNMLAVAGASRGNLLLLLFGLGLSIPFVILTSGFLSMLMDRYPIIIYVGSAILGKVGAEMVITDPAVTNLLHLPVLAHYAFEAFCAGSVIVAGKIALRRMIRADLEKQQEE